MDDRGKEPPTGRTKLADERESKIKKNEPEGRIVFIEHYPPRTSPRVTTLPIKEENEDDSPHHGVSLSIKKEYEYDEEEDEYDDFIEKYVFDDTKKNAIKEEYEYDDTKDNKGIDENILTNEEINITTRAAEEENLVEKLTLNEVEIIQGRFYNWLHCQMWHNNTLDSNGHRIVCKCFPEMPENEFIFGEGYKEHFKGIEEYDNEGRIYKKWRVKHGFEDD